MRILPFVLFLASACAAPQYALRGPLLPPAPPAAAPQSPGPALIAPVDEAATQRWLDQEIERNRYVPPPPPVEPPAEEPVQREVVRTTYVYGDPCWDPCYGGYYGPYWGSGRYYRSGRYVSSFPWNTAVGAGLGAVIGHQSGRRDRGALIGGGIGLLFDLPRWCW